MLKITPVHLSENQLGKSNVKDYTSSLISYYCDLGPKTAKCLTCLVASFKWLIFYLKITDQLDFTKIIAYKYYHNPQPQINNTSMSMSDLFLMLPDGSRSLWL